jgi:hydrogenase maturation protease
MSASRGRVLVAGIGNIFLGDDGFGVEVVGRIDEATLPASVDVADYGIRGIHLAYELLDGRYDTLIMVDAAPVDGPPGTLAVIEVDPIGTDFPGDSPTPAAIDGHGMHPQAVLELLRGIGGAVDRVLVVGCRPAVVDEREGLSDPVRGVVDDAVSLVTALAREEAAGRTAETQGRSAGA